MKNIFRAVLVFAAVIFAAGLPFAAEGNSATGQAADKSGDYVLTSARIFVSPKKEVQVDENANIVRETMLFHGELNAPDKVTGKCVLEYTWTIPSGRFSSKSLDKIRATSSITAKEASGEWTVRPREINMNLFFFKASDKELLAAVMDGKMADASPSALFKLKIMSLLPDQSAHIEEMVSNSNQSKWLPFERAWKGRTMMITPRDYPRAVLVVKVKGLLVDGYACYVYEYDPDGTKAPIQK
jgi:hypothetical protein